MNLKPSLAALAVFAIVWGAPALAQISAKSGIVYLGAGTQTLDSTARTTTYDRDVEIVQDDARLRCDHAVIVQAANANAITSIEATGNVYYVTKSPDGQQSVVRGDKAVYTNASDTIVITGAQVILTQGQNVMTGTRLVVQVGNGITTFDAPSGPGRVRGIVFPAKKQDK